MGMDVEDYNEKALEVIGKHPFKQLTRNPTKLLIVEVWRHI